MNHRHRSFVATLAIAMGSIVFALNTSTALVSKSPLPVPPPTTVFDSPLLQPQPDSAMQPPPPGSMEFAWVETPQRLAARAAPFVDQYGDTIVEEKIVYLREHHEPMIFDLKATLTVSKSKEPMAII
jgi:hypothetical protein